MSFDEWLFGSYRSSAKYGGSLEISRVGNLRVRNLRVSRVPNVMGLRALAPKIATGI